MGKYRKINIDIWSHCLSHKKTLYLPCDHSLFDVPEKAAVKFVDGVQVGKEETEEIIRKFFFLTNFVPKPLHWKRNGKN